MREPKPATNAIDVARELSKRLDEAGIDYALGGAIALGYWGSPRGTLDVDVTMYLPVDRPSDCAALLSDIGCEVSLRETAESLREHGFCRVSFDGMRVDVFLPTIPFYEAARLRRKTVDLAGQPVAVWDAETLAVFKMMFFRRKDLADIEQVLRSQGASFDRAWVREQLAAMYGLRDPRLSQWDELVNEIPGE